MHSVSRIACLVTCLQIRLWPAICFINWCYFFYYKSEQKSTLINANECGKLLRVVMLYWNAHTGEQHTHVWPVSHYWICFRKGSHLISFKFLANYCFCFLFAICFPLHYFVLPKILYFFADYFCSKVFITNLPHYFCSRQPTQFKTINFLFFVLTQTNANTKISRVFPKIDHWCDHSPFVKLDRCYLLCKVFHISLASADQISPNANRVLIFPMSWCKHLTLFQAFFAFSHNVLLFLPNLLQQSIVIYYFISLNCDFCFGYIISLLTQIPTHTHKFFCLLFVFFSFHPHFFYFTKLDF